MSLSAQAARVLAALAGMGQQFAGPVLGLSGLNDTGVNGERLAAILTNMGADALLPVGVVGFGNRVRLLQRVLGPKFSEFATKGLRQPGGAESGAKAAAAVDVLLWTIIAVEWLELTTGLGPAVEGDAFQSGAEKFTLLTGQLGAAAADDSWRGSASQAYEDVVVALQSVTQTLAEMDIQLAALVKSHADWVTHMRLGFGVLKNLLLVAFGIATAMMLRPPDGPVRGRVFAYTASAIGITVAAGMLTTLATKSTLNSQESGAVTAQYDDAIAAVVQRGGRFTESGLVVSAQSKVSRVDALSRSVFGLPASREEPAPVAKAADAAGLDAEADRETAQDAATAPGPRPQVAAQVVSIATHRRSGRPTAGTQLDRTDNAASPSFPQQSGFGEEGLAGAEGVGRAPVEPIGAQPLWGSSGPGSSDAAADAVVNNTPQRRITHERS